MTRISLDLETYSSVDITKAGLYKYVQAPDFEILLCAFRYDRDEVQQIDLTAGEQIPRELFNDLFSADALKKAWNAPFEWYCLAKYFNLSDPLAWLSQWHDTMVEALYCGFPAKLDTAGPALGIPEDKRKLAVGRALIREFCKPHAPTKRNGGRPRIYPKDDPEKWEIFKDYNRQDVVTESTIGENLTFFPVPEQVWREWRLDQKINLRGTRVDLDLITGAQVCSATANERLTAEAKEIAGLENPNSIAQLTKWINDETGETVEDLKKATVSALIKSTDDAKLRRLMEIRQDTGKTSVKKYAAMAAAVCDDGRVRGLVQFYGANRTGRWAGRIVQIQNLTKNHIDSIDLARQLVKDRKTDLLQWLYGSVQDILSQLVRTAFIPRPGHKYVQADFSAIEARVIAWLAGEAWRMNVFATHGKIYEASASEMFGVPMETIARDATGRDLGNYALRQRGKIAELALGYGGGVNALKTMDNKHELNEEDLPDIVRRWRTASPRIVDLWWACERAAFDTIETGRTNVVRYVSFGREIDHSSGRDFMTIQLPGGRKLYYDHPALVPGDRGNRITYNGVNQITKKWGPIETYGGKLVENIVQAIARDCLALTLERLDGAGFNPVFHIHDEVVNDQPLEMENALDTAIAIMSRPIPWAPGLLLRADGFEAQYYKKE